jgi:hypothetical protein
MNDRETGGRIKTTPGMTLERAINLVSSNKGYVQLLNARGMGKPAPSVFTAGFGEPYDCGRVYNSSPSPDWLATVICTKCKGTGHYWRDCPTGTGYVPSGKPPPETDKHLSAMAREPRPSSAGSSYKGYSPRVGSRSPSAGRSNSGRSSQGSYNKGDKSQRSFTLEYKRNTSAPKSPNGERPRKEETAPRTSPHK